MEPEHERRCHAWAHNHKDPTTTLSRVAEHSAMTFTLLGLDDPRLVRTGIVTGNYFSVMGLRPEVGRVLDTGDDGENAAPVMLLTYDFWGRVFGFDPTVVSRRLQVNGRTLEVVGVLTPPPPIRNARTSSSTWCRAHTTWPPR
jgi:putative ABC transport system permease protein